MRKIRGFAPFSHTAHLRFYKKKSTGMAWVDMAVAWNLPCGRNHTLDEDVLNRVTGHCFLPLGITWQWQVPSMMEGSWSSHTSVVNGRASVVYLVPSRWEVPGPGPGVRAGT